jgi:hypothetical protein
MITIAIFLTSALGIQAGNSVEYQAAYETAFRRSFRSRSIEQCVASAKNAAAAKIDVSPICACVADRLLATKSTEDLKTQPPAAELQSLSTKCIAANLPSMRSEQP